MSKGLGWRPQLHLLLLMELQQQGDRPLLCGFLEGPRAAGALCKRVAHPRVPLSLHIHPVMSHVWESLYSNLPFLVTRHFLWGPPWALQVKWSSIPALRRRAPSCLSSRLSTVCFCSSTWYSNNPWYSSRYCRISCYNNPGAIFLCACGLKRLT